MANKLRKEIIGPCTGVRFELRRVKIADYMREMNDLPFSLAPGTVEELDKLKDTIEKLPKEKLDELNARSMRLFLGKGIVRMQYPNEDWQAPNIWLEDDADCPDGFVTIADFGSDADLISVEIAEFSFNLQGVKALTGFFQRKESVDPAPRGEEIRTEAVEPAAA